MHCSSDIVEASTFISVNASCLQRMGYNIIIILSVLFLVARVQVAPNNCSDQYQAALQQVLDVKEKCGEVAYKDCCEVGYHFRPAQF